MRRRYLTEAQAWRKVARMFAGRRSAATSGGLCLAIQFVNVSDATDDRMEKRIRGAKVGEGSYVYTVQQPCWFKNIDGTQSYFTTNDRSKEARMARSSAALWFALEAEHEAGSR